MKNKISNDHRPAKIPWNFIGQVALILIFFYILSRLITSLSFTGMNKPEVQATAGVSSQEIFDNFGFEVFDVKWNESTWAEIGTGSRMKQLDGVLLFSRETDGFGGLFAHRRKWSLSQIKYVESRLMLSSDIQTQAGEIEFEIYTTADANQWFIRCGIQGGVNEKTALILCITADKFSTTPVEVPYDTWHTARFEVDDKNAAFTFFVDGQNAGTYIPQDISGFKLAEYYLMLGGESSNDGLISGSFDYVQLEIK